MLGSIDFSSPQTLFSLVALVVSLLSISWAVFLHLRLRRFMRGGSGENLEHTLSNMLSRQEHTERFRTDLEGYLESVEARLKRSVQAVETIRFNPFHGDGTGGNQSFSSVFVNEEGDGVVFTGLHARERVLFYAKPLKTYTSSHELTEEESQLLKKAQIMLAGEKARGK